MAEELVLTRIHYYQKKAQIYPYMKVCDEVTLWTTIKQFFVKIYGNIKIGKPHVVHKV